MDAFFWLQGTVLSHCGTRKSVHSSIPDIYIAPLHETYSEALSVQLRPKRNVLRSLQKEDTFFRGNKRSVRGSSFLVGRGANHRESSTLFKRRAGPRNLYNMMALLWPMTFL